MNEAEWVPVCSLANDLSCTKERSAEAAQIARLRASRIISCSGNNSSTSAEEEEAWHSDAQSTNPSMDTDPKPGDKSEDGTGGQTDLEDAVEGNQWRHPRNREAIMEEAEGLAYDDPRSDSDAMVTGAGGSQGPALSLHDEATNSPPHTPRSAVLHMPGLTMDHMLPLEVAVTGKDTVKVHVDEAELDNL